MDGERMTSLAEIADLLNNKTVIIENIDNIYVNITTNYFGADDDLYNEDERDEQYD